MNFLIYGEDCRHAFLSALLTEAGLVMQAPADLLILSPKESFSTHKDVIKKNCLIWGGPASETSALQIEGYQKIEQCETFRIKNSVYTAEGALALAISESQTALCESTVSVLGYGYLGKECTRLFSAVGADVTVYTENPAELLQAAQNGVRAKKLTEMSVPYGSILLNTIPSPVLDALPVAKAEKKAPDTFSITKTIKPVLLIELASIPCLTKAIDNIRVVPAGALPSRFSPESAAKLIFEEIMYQIKKE